MISDNGISGQQFFQLFSILVFVGLFAGGVLIAYLYSKRVEKRKTHLSRYQEIRKRFLKAAVIGGFFSAFWLYSLITNNNPLGLIGIQANPTFEFFFLLYLLFFGWPLFALSLGIQIGSLIFPVKKPPDSLSS